MDLYIPEHLRNIGVIKQLCTLVEEYSKVYEENIEDSFDDYDYSLKVDPVKKFINMCLPEESVYGPKQEGDPDLSPWVLKDGEFKRVAWEKDQDYEITINYLTRLFYGVKGTTTVLTYLKQYLGLRIVGEITYTPHYVEFYVDQLEVDDEGLFRDALEDFLGALLFWEELNVNFGKVSLTVHANMKSYMNGGAVCYRYYTATPFNT